MTLVDILNFGHFLANAIKNHKFASLASGSEHLFKYVTYVTWHNECVRNCLGSKRGYLKINTIFHMFSY